MNHAAPPPGWHAFPQLLPPSGLIVTEGHRKSLHATGFDPDVAPARLTCVVPDGITTNLGDESSHAALPDTLRLRAVGRRKAASARIRACVRMLPPAPDEAGRLHFGLKRAPLKSLIIKVRKAPSANSRARRYVLRVF
jgi:hypothetical protein